jgi:hypothetical protein
MEKEEVEDDLEVTFTGVCVHRKQHVHVCSIVDEYAEAGQDHALIFSWINGQWTHRPIENSISGLCVIEEPKPKVLNIGVDGGITVFSLPGFGTERVDPSKNGPSYSRQLKCVRKISEHVYVAGMKRQVYRRESAGQWTRFDAGVLAPVGHKLSVGFLSIDGLSEKEIYGVGYKGEIWICDAGQWKHVESPTNVLLTNVRCLSSEVAYACGLAGVVLRGYRERWTIIKQDVTEGDFWGMTVFRGQLYLSNYAGVFILQDDVLKRVNTNLPDITTAYLDSCRSQRFGVQ